MNLQINDTFDQETPEAKARWFQSLTLSERMDMLCSFTEFILSVNPNIVEQKSVDYGSRRVCVLSIP